MSDREVARCLEQFRNQLLGLDLTWQPIDDDLNAHTRRGALQWGYTVGSEIVLGELVYCVIGSLTEKVDTPHIIQVVL